MRILFALGLTLICMATASGAPPRYSALLSGGQRIQGDKLTDWHDKNAIPRLEGQPLLEPSNAFRWLRDRSLRAADLPMSYVEFHGGDRLPGVVSGYASGNEQPYASWPAHLVVQSAQAFEPPENRAVSEVRVALASVRRIVWQRRGRTPLVPGTAIFRDGRQLAYRAIRFHPGQCHLLLPDGGDERIAWSDLAELHLPAVDAWDAWYDELVQLCPDLTTRLYQVETTSGLVATASLARWAPRFEGNSGEPDRWVHGIQPAWSLNILWVPCREMAVRRSWLPHEVPLSRVQAVATKARAAVHAAINANCLGGPLRSQSLDFGWGFGTRGRCELAFDVPRPARSFRAQVCLDRSAGKGGCVVARVFAGAANGNPLWQSPVIVGSENVVDTGALGLTRVAEGQLRVMLQIDSVDKGRPTGADPLEIRDHANWCDPLLELDPAGVQAELDRRLAQRSFAWSGWEVGPVGGGTMAEAGVEASMQRDERLPPPGTFQQAIQAKSKALSLINRLTVGPGDEWLVIAATRPFSRGQEPKLEVRIGGEPVAEFTVPERQQDANENRPLTVPLSAYRQPAPVELDVEIRQLAAADSAPVDYRAIETASQLPTLYRVFEERDAVPESAVVVDDDRHAGTRAMKLATEREHRLALPAPIRIRERPAWGDYRFVRFAVRKIGGGLAALGFEGNDLGQQRRYDLGQGHPAFGGAIRVWHDVGKEWIVITRDLYADFGNFDANAILFGALGGEAVLFDHVYLARGHYDLDRIPQAPPAEAVNEKAREELARPLVERARPATALIEFADGRVAAGAIFAESGEILTAGHAVIGPGRKARVRLANGTELAAKTLGVAREFDLGILRIEPPGSFAKLDPDAPAELPQQQAYVALSYRPQAAEFEPPVGQAVALRRVFRSTVWTDLAADDQWLAGGPLVNRDGRLVGIQVRQSRFGGVLCTRFQDVWPHLQRLRNGEVFGAWQAGSQPAIGATGRGKREGFEIVDLTAGGPAEKAGLKAGDVVTRIEGRPIANEDDMQVALAERDAGQEIVVDYSRGGAAAQARMKLTPRVP